jgi:hypothetical protein
LGRGGLASGKRTDEKAPAAASAPMSAKFTRRIKRRMSGTEEEQTENGVLTGDAFRTALTTAVLTSVGLVTALFWVDAVRALIDRFAPKRSTILMKILVALAITVAQVILAVLLAPKA